MSSGGEFPSAFFPGGVAQRAGTFAAWHHQHYAYAIQHP